MTRSEKLLSSFSKDYFFKEFVYADLKFTPKGGTEIELADLIINLEDVILAIQLKERNEKDRTQDKNIEEKWLKKKCKMAKKQIKDTLGYIQNSEAEFYNARGRKTKINPNAEMVSLVVFENKSISEYEHLLRSHTSEGLNVNCMSIDDFQYMCKELIAPIEIIEYIKWRKDFYEKNGSINFLLTQMNAGFFVSKPQKHEALVHQYLYEQYGENAILENKKYYDLFRRYTSVLQEHTEFLSETDGCYEIMLFLAHLFRKEVKGFGERVEKSVIAAKQKSFEVVGTLCNTQREYAIVFEATEKGEYIEPDKLLAIIREKRNVHILLQVIAYWINEEEYRIDFSLQKDNSI